MFYSTIFSILAVCLLLFLLVTNISSVVRPEILPLMPNIMDLKFEMVKIALLAFAIPITTFFGLIIQHKLNKR
jgi:hypothetical protein